MYDLSILNGSVYLDGRFQPANLYIKDGVFVKIGSDIEPAEVVLEAKNRLVLPGLIDPHVHFALDLGRFQSADDFFSGSRTAAFGGITTFIDFLEPTDNAIDLEKAYVLRLAEAKHSVVDYQFHATIKNPQGNLEAYVLKMLELGMTSVKLFTTYSESGRQTYDPAIIELLLLSKKYHFLVTAHIENNEMIHQEPADTYADLARVRPSESETTEALKLAGFARQTGGNLYMVHLSSGETLSRIKSEYATILNKTFFIESCPHYFTLTNAKFHQPDGFLYTMAPPVRTESERQKLISLFPFVDTIGTDHCPFLRSQKNHVMLRHIPLGIGGIEHSFDLMYHQFGDAIIDKMTKNPALIHRLAPRKGTIQLGADADVVIYRIDPTATIKNNHSNCDYDLYLDFPVAGHVESTILRGNFILKNGQFVGGIGRLVPRSMNP
jgi:dihydropyrimidinase